MEYILSFSTTNHAIIAEDSLLKEGLSIKVMPVPSAIRSGCGICLRVTPEELPFALKALTKASIPVEGLYERQTINGVTTITRKEAL